MPALAGGVSDRYLKLQGILSTRALDVEKSCLAHAGLCGFEDGSKRDKWADTPTLLGGTSARQNRLGLPKGSGPGGCA